MTTYRELLSQVKGEIDEIDARAAAPSLGGRAPSSWTSGSSTSGTRGTFPARSTCRAGASSRAIENAVPDRRQPHRRLLRERRPLGVRDQDAGGARLRRTWSTSRAATRSGSGTASRPSCRKSLGEQQRAPLQPPSADPRGRRGGTAQAARVADPPDRRRRAGLARVRSTSPPPASARSGSSTTTPSTRRTSSARSSTRPSASATRRPSRRSGRSRRSTRTSASPPTASGSPPRTSTGSSATGWDVIVDGADNFPTRYLLNDASVWHGIPVVHGSIFRFEGQVTVFKPRAQGPCYRCLFRKPPPPGAGAELRRGRRPRRAPRRDRLDPGDRGAEARARDRRPARRPAAALRRPGRVVHRGHAPPRPGLPGLRRRADASPSTSTTSSSARAQGWQRRQAWLEGGRTHDRFGSRRRSVRRPAASARCPAVGHDRRRAARRPDLPLPGARGQLQFANVYVDGEDIRTLDELETPVREGATVILLPAMAGGVHG